jgi:hypothetical protein
MKKILKTIFPVIILFGLVLIFLNKGVMMKGIFFSVDEIASDLVHFSYPYREYWADEFLKKGMVPLWNQYIAGGLPVLAEAQTGIFYPISILLFSILPVAVAFNWLIISCYLLVAVGTYFYSLSIGQSKRAAFFSALVFTFSGYMVARLRHVPIITAVAFMPLAFLAVEKIIKDNILWAIGLAFFVAFSFFAGHLTTTYVILLALTFYFLIRIYQKFKDEGREAVKPVFIFGAAILVGIILSSVQLLPSAELIKYSTRSPGDPGYLEYGQYKLKYLAMFVSPYVYGDPSKATWDINAENYWENIGYIGILPLILGGAGIFWGLRKRNRLVQALSILTLLFFLLMLGGSTPLYKIFWDFIPGFSITRISGRFLLFVDFFLAVLAGFSLDFIQKKLGNIKYIFVYLIIVSVSVIDLWLFGYTFNNVIPLSYLDLPESAQFLSQDKSLFRYTSLFKGDSWRMAWKDSVGWRGDLSAFFAQREILPPDFNLIFRLASSSLIYSNSGHFGVKSSADLDNYINTLYLEKGVFSPNLLAAMNIKYIVTSLILNKTDGFELVKTVTSGKDSSAYVYKNVNWLPRAYFVAKGINFTDPQDVLGALSGFDPRKEVLLLDSPEFPEGGEGTVEIVNYESNRVQLETNSLKGGFLVLSDTFYPGWKAYVDGNETPIYRANYTYRAIHLTKGKHQIIFVYDPMSFRIGEIVSGSMFTIIIASGLLFVYLHARKRLWK